MKKAKILRIVKWVVGSLAVLIVMLGVVAICFGATNMRWDENGKDDETKVACIGNSITYGFGVFNWISNAYPKQLGNMLGEGFWVKNFGLNGATILNSGDKPYADKTVYKESLAFQPDIVVLMLGTNDTKEWNWKGVDEFKKQYIELIKTYQELVSAPEIYLCTPAVAFNVKSKAYGIENEHVEEVTAVVQEIAQEKGLHLIDINSLTAINEEWFEFDGIHPNADGANGMAQLIAREIRP